MAYRNRRLLAVRWARFLAEDLESRRLLTTTINGTPNQDLFNINRVSNQVRVTLNGVATTYPLNEPLILNGGDTFDVFNINSTGTGAITVNGGAGVDGVTIGSGSVLSDTQTSSITVNGDSNGVRITVDNKTESGSDQVWDLDGSSIDLYPFGSTTISRSIHYTSVLSTQIDGGSIAEHFYTHGTINLAGGEGTYLYGNGGNDSLVTDGYLTAEHVRNLQTNMTGNVSFNGGQGVDSALADDTDGPAAANSFYMVSNSIGVSYNGASSHDAFLTDVESVSLSANSGDNTIFIFITAATAPYDSLFINAGAGNDTLNSTNPDIGRELAGINVTLTGGIGDDTLTFRDGNTAATNYGLIAGVISVGAYGTTPAASIHYNAWETLSLATSAADSLINVSGVDTFVDHLSIDAYAGNDTISFSGDLDDSGANGFGGVPDIFVSGGAGTNQLNVFDQDTEITDADTYLIATQQITKGPTATPTFHVDYLAMQSVLLAGSNSSTTYNVFQPGAPTTIQGGNKADVFNASLSNTPVVLAGGDEADTFNMTGGTGTIRGGAGLDVVNVNADGGSSAGFTVDALEDWASLNMYEGSRGTLVGSGAISTTTTPFLRGTLDLGNRYLIVRSPSTSFVLDKVSRGYNGGDWAGVPAGGANGVITSSTAQTSAISDGIGYATIGSGAGQLNKVGFGDYLVQSGNLVLTYALRGDTNLDRKVDFTDLVALAQSYNLAGRNWLQGDSNYDGTTNFSDLVSLAQNFNTTLPAAKSSSPSLRSIADDVLAG